MQVQETSMSAQSEKAFSTLRAKLAQHGFSAYRSESANGAAVYFISRWGRVREFNSIDTLQTFARIVGVPA